MSARLRGPLRLLLAALILVAVGRTFVYSWATLGAMPNLFNFFGFFTVQSNLLAAAVLLLLGGHDLTGRAQPGWLPVARGCVTVYVIIVGIVYAVLLAPLGEAGGVPIAWANTVLHIISPILMPVGWLVFRDRPPLPWRALPWVLAYPFVWLLVVLLRGATDGWVPYPFLAPSNGYPTVFGYCLAIFALGMGVGAVVWWLGRLLPGDSSAGAAPVAA